MNDMMVEVKICTRTALHLGSGKGNETTDALLRRNAQGRLFLPGSAIAGALRAICTRLTPRLNTQQGLCQAIKEEGNFRANDPCGCWVCNLFGDVNPQEADEKRQRNQPGGIASRLWVYDAEYEWEKSAATSIRDGVGIDRATRTAARQGAVKFDLEVLPAGAEFTIRLVLSQVRDATTQKRNEALLALTLAEWEDNRGSLGGRVARGLGAFDVQSITWHERDLTDIEKLMVFLKRKEAETGKVPSYFVGFCPSLPQNERQKQAKQQYPVQAWQGNQQSTNLADYAVARSWAVMDLTLQFEGPMLVNDVAMARRSGFDHAPIAAIANGQHWVLPGSGLRGIIRSQAERIARTVATHQAVSQQQMTPRDYFLIHNPAGDPNVSGGQAKLANSDALLTAAGVDGTVRVKPVHLDLADQLFGSVRMGSRLLVEDGALICVDGKKTRLKAMDFLAIDRFTGGGRDSAKFDAVALWRPAFKTRLRLDNPQAWELGWLLLTLRDLHEGLCTIGFGSAKGFGAVTIQQATVTLGWLHKSDFPADEQFAAPFLTQAQTSESSLWHTLSDTWMSNVQTQDWLPLVEAWVQAFNDAVLKDDATAQFVRISDDEFTSFRDSGDPQHLPMGTPYQVDDTYFTEDASLLSLYPVLPSSVVNGGAV
jgi:CRISPR/Cas system CSM-associated protein Csm3 (group 7 of RAMP superfamily)